MGGNILNPAIRRQMELKVEELNKKLEEVDARLEEAWNITDYRERNILVHKINVAESRRKGEWMHGDHVELLTIKKQ